jgi:hypothetical protein
MYVYYLYYNCLWCVFYSVCGIQGLILDFKLGGEHLKKLGYFVWKITILRQKNHIFSNFRGGTALRRAPPWIRPWYWMCSWMDLKPPYFYLWGYLKDYVYVNNPQTIGELKAAITAKIRQIPKEECVRVIDNFARRMQVCLQRRGCHLEHILKRT